MGIGMVCIMMTLMVSMLGSTVVLCTDGDVMVLEYKSTIRPLGPRFRVYTMWRLHWWADSTRSLGSSLHRVSVCMSVRCIPQHPSKLHIFTGRCSFTQMGHVKYPYECAAIRMRHAAVSMSKCTPVHAVYKVHPDSNSTVSHPLLGQTVISPLISYIKAICLSLNIQVHYNFLDFCVENINSCIIIAVHYPCL